MNSQTLLGQTLFLSPHTNAKQFTLEKCKVNEMLNNNEQVSYYPVISSP